ncbi:MAG: nucleotidyltransferase family protein [Pirellulaceae bacterium]|nr:nucleotidyltransferase family protein [Planctomycetales bacterium]
MSELVTERLDWEVVLDRCWWHRIRPLTYRHLRELPDGRIPDHVLSELSGHATELAIRGQRLAAVLEEVARYFQQAGVRVLVFKGPTLCRDAYGDLALRECGDLDLIIDRTDFEQVSELLTTEGFTSWWERRDKNRQVFACEFERADGTLDVHWDLAPSWFNYRVDFDRLWKSGTPLEAACPLVRKLSIEDSLAVLSIHGAKHWWERIRWICDVAELINRGEIIDWNRVDEAARQANCRRTVALGTWLAGKLLSAKVPVAVMERLDGTPGISGLGRQVSEWLRYAERGAERRRVGERFRFRMGLCEQPRDRLAQILRYLISRP